MKTFNLRLFQYGATTFTISHLFGGPFFQNFNCSRHRNWYSTSLEAFTSCINPVVSRALVQKSTITRDQFKDLADQINSYHYLLRNPIDNEDVLEYFW